MTQILYEILDLSNTVPVSVPQDAQYITSAFIDGQFRLYYMSDNFMYGERRKVTLAETGKGVDLNGDYINNSELVATIEARAGYVLNVLVAEPLPEIASCCGNDGCRCSEYDDYEDIPEDAPPLVIAFPILPKEDLVGNLWQFWYTKSDGSAALRKLAMMHMKHDGEVVVPRFGIGPAGHYVRGWDVEAEADSNGDKLRTFTMSNMENAEFA